MAPALYSPRSYFGYTLPVTHIQAPGWRRLFSAVSDEVVSHGPSGTTYHRHYRRSQALCKGFHFTIFWTSLLEDAAIGSAVQPGGASLLRAAWAIQLEVWKESVMRPPLLLQTIASSNNTEVVVLMMESPWRRTIHISRGHTASGYNCDDEKQGGTVRPAATIDGERRYWPPA
jgi:hypothetical protein